MAHLSTAGAVPVTNQQGKTSMQKVKVQRYVSGRVPNYAIDAQSESDSSSDEEEVKPQRRQQHVKEEVELLNEAGPSSESVELDPRLRRLMRPKDDDREEDESENRHHIIERRRPQREVDSGESDDNEDDSIERRHAILRQRMLAEEEELMKQESDDNGSSEDEEEEESEYEEYTDTDEEDLAPRLKPVFIVKRDRVTHDTVKLAEIKEKEDEIERRRVMEERRAEALRLIEAQRKFEDTEEERKDQQQLSVSIAAVNTDDENEELSYVQWKVREMKRIKREKEEREAYIKERQEIEKLRGMTEEQRLAELKNKVITNKTEKGKYKFMQKYYHRGAFFMDQEEDVFKRDFAQPTLEDHFDKTILPKIMQVKNFGRSGRTKYTHLVDQDTTAFDSPWSNQTTVTSKFLSNQAGGMKSQERPSKKRK